MANGVIDGEFALKIKYKNVLGTGKNDKDEFAREKVSLPFYFVWISINFF